MAQVTFSSPFIASMSGALTKDSKFSYFTRNGKTFTMKKGKRSTPYSPQELDARQRFRQAIKWASLVQSDSLLTATYRVNWKLQQSRYPTFRGFLVHYYYANFTKS